MLPQSSRGTRGHQVRGCGVLCTGLQAPVSSVELRGSNAWSASPPRLSVAMLPPAGQSAEPRRLHRHPHGMDGSCAPELGPEVSRAGQRVLGTVRCTPRLLHAAGPGARCVPLRRETRAWTGRCLTGLSEPGVKDEMCKGPRPVVIFIFGSSLSE